VGNRPLPRKGNLPVDRRQPPLGLDVEAPEFTTREAKMNWDRVEGNWKQFRGKVKEQWGKLTEDDIAVINGRQDQLVGRIQERYGIAKEEAERQIDGWINRM
jgi:uncharacterized protein YjbJ (UPF0337 family)